MWDNKKVSKAIFLATQKHNGQVMKHPTGMPYSAHFTNVLMEALNFAQGLDGIDFDLLVCSAILHDVLEDTNTSYEEIASEFGEKIANGVLALTKDKNLPKSQQMEDSLNRILQQPIEIAIVKMADRMFNIRDRVPSWSNEKVAEYKAESELIFKRLGFVNEKMSESLKEEIQKY